MTDPSTIRRQALEEALAAVEQVERRCWGSDGHPLIDRVDARTAIQALLAADPREASEPSLSAPRASAPADHGPRAADDGETGTKSYHDGVRDALAALGMHDNDLSGDDAAYNLEAVVDDMTNRFVLDDGGVCLRTILRVIDQLEAARALLPQPKDEAEEIVERYCADLGIVPTPDARAVSIAMLRRHLSGDHHQHTDRG